MGQIEAFAFSFAPQGWFPCDGRLLPIRQNQALFALLGNRFGGDGKTNFALPKLAPVAPNGPGYFIARDGIFPSRT
jgi:microcystin-dependent protein